MCMYNCCGMLRRGLPPHHYDLAAAPFCILSPLHTQDRVETSPEQMAAATALAERLTRETGVRTRAIGWFHSHPHITVLPSHVDVATQALYQQLEPGFVGLIFSAFNRDGATKGDCLLATAFQAAPAGGGAGGFGGGGGSAAHAHGGGGGGGFGDFSDFGDCGGGGGVFFGGGGGAAGREPSSDLMALDSDTRDAVRAAAAAGESEREREREKREWEGGAILCVMCV